MILGHGDDAFAYSTEIVENFSSNVPFLNSADKIIRHLQDKCHTISHYPDPSYRELRALIAHRHKVSSSHILLTNGSAEAFYLLAHLFAKQKTLIATPSFAEYEDACNLYHHEIDAIPYSELGKVEFSVYDTFWLGLPNNPDGYMLAKEQLERWIGSNPRTHFIADTAYSELSVGRYDTSLWIDRFENWIEVHSLTKTFAIPGVRIGYIVASPSIIEALERFRIPWSVNSLAVEAGGYILEHYTDLLPPLERLIGLAQQLMQQLSKIEGVEVYPSTTPFFLARLPWGSSLELKDFLVQEYGYLIRSAHNFRGLEERYIRIAARDENANKTLVQGIAQYIKQNRTLITSL